MMNMKLGLEFQTLNVGKTKNQDSIYLNNYYIIKIALYKILIYIQINNFIYLHFSLFKNQRKKREVKKHQGCLIF